MARPICRRVSKPRSAFAWYLLLAVAASGLAVLVSLRFGSTEAPVQDGRLASGYVAAWALLAIGLSMLARRRAIKGSLPFAPGIYVFPVDVVDARTRELVLYPLSKLEAFDFVHHEADGKYTHSTLRFVFPTATFTFESRDRDVADAKIAAVQEARANVAGALERGGLSVLAAVDPFAEARARLFVPARDHGLLARGRPTWTRFIWAITIVVGLTFGVASWRGRNLLSDDRAFARVAAVLDVSLAEAYLRGGGLHVAEVETAVLPRAHLAAAKKERVAGKRADAIVRIVERFPKSAIETDARTALAEAQHEEFLAQSGTVSGLRAFIARWPLSADVPAARARIAELYRQTLAGFRKHANVTDKSVVPVVEAALAYAEERGLPLEVRFRRRNAASLAAADKFVTEGVVDDGGSPKRGPVSLSLAAPEDATRREAALVVALQRSLRRVFPADVIALRLGAPLDGPSPIPGTQPFADVSAPTLVVDYEIGWGGTTYVARDPSRRFAGIVVKLDVTMQVPSEPRVLYFGTTIEPPDTLPVEYSPIDPAFQTVLAPAAPRTNVTGDARVYGVMVVRAFDQLASRWKTAFFEANSTVAREAFAPAASPTQP